MSLHSQLDQLASSFAQAVFQAIRELSLEELVAETGGLRGMKMAPGPVRPARPARPARQVRPERESRGRRSGRAATRGPRRSSRGPSRRLKRRSRDEIQSALGAIVSLVEKRPRGLRAEQIRSELGMEAKEMPRVLGEGLATRKLRKRGQKRATTYYAA
jgi:hypothetical protein